MICSHFWVSSPKAQYKPRSACPGIDPSDPPADMPIGTVTVLATVRLQAYKAADFGFAIPSRRALKGMSGKLIKDAAAIFVKTPFNSDVF
jgi:hypothetical protein